MLVLRAQLGDEMKASPLLGVHRHFSATFTFPLKMHIGVSYIIAGIISNTVSTYLKKKQTSK